MPPERHITRRAALRKHRIGPCQQCEGAGKVSFKTQALGGDGRQIADLGHAHRAKVALLRLLLLRQGGQLTSECFTASLCIAERLREGPLKRRDRCSLLGQSLRLRAAFLPKGSQCLGQRGRHDLGVRLSLIRKVVGIPRSPGGPEGQ